MLEIDPLEKKELYDALTKDGMTLQDWFLRHATSYLRERGQGQLFAPMLLAETPVTYDSTPANARKKKGGKGKRKGKV